MLDRTPTSAYPYLLQRRVKLFVATLGLLLMAGCASAPPKPSAEALKQLAPVGELRVGVYPGSPSSLVKLGTAQESAGVSHDLGLLLAKELGVPARIVAFERVANVVDAIKNARVDFTVTNASPARAREVDFAPTLISIELGYLAPANSRLKSIDEIDEQGHTVGVTEGSSSLAALSQAYKKATLRTVPNLAEAARLLRAVEITAFATNKAILYELADGVPGAKLLPGEWGVEHMAIAIPKQPLNQEAKAHLAQFGERVTRDGRLAKIIERAGLRGTIALE